MLKLFFAFCLSQVFAAPVPLKFKQVSEGQNITAEQILKVDDVIWGFDFLPDGRIVFTEREGRMRIFDPRTEALTLLKGVPKVLAEGQGGLLDVKLHPDFKNNRLVYFVYAIERDGINTTALARAELAVDSLDNLKVLFVAKGGGSKDMHFGARIAFDNKGYLFLCIGERNERHDAQSLSTHSGKTVRLHDDGRVPQDNPFAAKTGALPEIWSYGHRNPQGMYYDLDSGELWLSEHGPRGGDELNLIRPGKNYGWPVITYGREYYGPKIGEPAKEGMEQPVKYYVPSIAPSGLVRYKGDHFSKWKNDFFTGALVLTHLNRLVIRDGKPVKEERLLKEWGERIRNVKQGPDGFIYVSTDSGKLARLR
jgi:glucose/arabinose dehydrogenase